MSKRARRRASLNRQSESRRRKAVRTLEMLESVKHQTMVAYNLGKHLEQPKTRAGKLAGLTPAEDAFARKAAGKGWKVYRNGWPDFLCRDPETDAVFFVEVKAATDNIRVEQETLFAVLELAGVTVRIFTPGKDTLMHWRTYAYGSREAGLERSKELLERRLASVVLADAEAREALLSAQK